MYEELLTIDEVCRWLQVSKVWVYRQAREGNIPHIKLGHFLRFHKPAVEKWIMKNQVAIK